jgi:hypothetical protein
MLTAGVLMPASQVLAVTPTTSFVGAMLKSSPCELLVATHELFYVLAGVKEEHDEVRCFHLQGGGGGRGRGRTHGGSHTGEIQQLHVVIVCYFPRMAISAAALTFFSRITNNLSMVHLGMSTS